MTNPDPVERRTGSNRQGASQLGCWLKVKIWMTDFSGSAEVAIGTHNAAQASEKKQ